MRILYCLHKVFLGILLFYSGQAHGNGLKSKGILIVMMWLDLVRGFLRLMSAEKLLPFIQFQE